jgi:predicted secreted hydrolase
MRTARRNALLGLVFGLLLAGCAQSASPLPDPTAPAATDIANLRPIDLPRDHRPHQDLTEWWYFTGHLQDQEGFRFGFEFVIFAANRQSLGSSFAAHLAISDQSPGSFRYAERTSNFHGAASWGDRLCVGGWNLDIGDSGFTIAASDDAFGLDLKLRPQKPPVLHGQGGVIDFGAVGWSYYYSQTRLAVEGRVTLAGVERDVTGLAWFDHQWGDFLVTGQGGWDWFSLQLEDGRELMATALRDADGDVSTTYGTLVGESGNTEHLDAAALQILVLDRWRSPHSGADYPARWRLIVPAAGLDLDLVPTIPDQELDTRASTGTIYWEGSVDARQAGQPAGRGFVELTGYAQTGEERPPETAVRQNLCGPTSQ